MIDAPLFAGATNVTRSEPAATFVAFASPGCPGAPAVITPVFADNALRPTALRAAMLNWYARPLVRPEICCVVFVESNVFAGCATEPRYGVTT